MSTSDKIMFENHANSIKNWVLDRPEDSGERLGDHFDNKSANVYSVLNTKIKTRTSFSWSCSLLFFFSDFRRFWVPEASIPGPFLDLLWKLWAFWKTAESVVTVANVRDLTPPRQSLLQFLAVGAFRWWFFNNFSWFLAVSGTGSELFQVCSALKRKSENPCKKRC